MDCQRRYPIEKIKTIMKGKKEQGSRKCSLFIKLQKMFVGNRFKLLKIIHYVIDTYS